MYRFRAASVDVTMYTLLYPSIEAAMALMSLSASFAFDEPTASLMMSPTAPVFSGKEDVYLSTPFMIW
jgi:hypothetical protein